MGFFGKKSSKESKDKLSKGNEKSQVGAVYVAGATDGTMPTGDGLMRDVEGQYDNLPVATLVDAPCVAATAPMPATAHCVATAPPLKQGSVQYNQATAVRGSTQQKTARYHLTRMPCMLPECPHCHQESRTKVHTYPNFVTYIVAVVLLFVFWPIFWIPLVLDAAKQTDHYCALCEQKVGSAQPFSDCCELRRS